MALVKMKDLLRRAEEKNIGCGAFSVGNMEMVRGAIRAAEELDTPIILQIAEVRLDHSPLHLMGPMMLEAARNAKVDVAVHLDHGLKFETIKKALEYGFTSVMLDASRDSFEENFEKLFYKNLNIDINIKDISYKYLRDKNNKIKAVSVKVTDSNDTDYRTVLKENTTY